MAPTPRLNSGRISINLKPLDQRDRSASDVIRRLNTSLAQVSGIRLFMQPVQNISVDDRVSRTQYQYTLEDPDVNELERVDRTDLSTSCRQLPSLEDVATDQQTGGLTVSLVIDRVTASRLGIAPSTDRSARSTMRSASARSTPCTPSSTSTT